MFGKLDPPKLWGRDVTIKLDEDKKKRLEGLLYLGASSQLEEEFPGLMQAVAKTTRSVEQFNDPVISYVIVPTMVQALSQTRAGSCESWG